MKSNNYSDALENAYHIFLNSAENCIAYQHFLEDNHIRVKKNASSKEFLKLPLTDKNNYFRKFSLTEKLYKNKSLSDYYMICTSSGSTGEPTIWPRDFETDNHLVQLNTEFLDSHFEIKKKKTLIVIAFGLGTTTAGMLQSRLSWEANHQYKISVITPGVDAQQTVSLLEAVYQNFEQIVCVGYPPFISEFIQLALEQNVRIKNWNLKIAFTSESVSSNWRKQMAEIISEPASAKNIVAFYATTEAGIIGIETPFTNKIINICLKNKALAQELFQSDHLPTLVEVNFMKKFVEVIDGEIVITLDQSFPLIRYNLHDKAKFISSADVKKALTTHSISTESEIYPAENKIFLAVFGRNEQSLSDYSFQIEDIRLALETTDLTHYIHTEFQYKQTQIRKNHLHIKIIVYKRKHNNSDISINDFLKKINLTLQNIAIKQHSQAKITSEIEINNEDQLQGYKAGKLRYFQR